MDAEARSGEDIIRIIQEINALTKKFNDDFIALKEKYNLPSAQLFIGKGGRVNTTTSLSEIERMDT